MTIALFVILYSLFAYIAWRNFRHALGIIVFLLPTYLVRLSIGPLPTTMLEGLLLITFVIWTIRTFIIERRTFTNIVTSITQFLNFPISLPLLLFFAASVISVFVSPNWYAALGVWRAYILEPLIFFFILLDTAKRDERTMHTIIIALAASAFVLSAIAIYQYFTGWMIPRPWQAWSGRRVTSIFRYPNALGLSLAPIIVLITGWIIHKKNKVVLTFFGSSVLLSFVAILAARSHGAIAGVAAGLFFFGIIQKKLRILSVTLLILVSVIIGAYAPWRTYVISYITFTTPSGKVRLGQYQETWNMLRDKHWLFGAGLSGYKKTVKPYHKNKRIEIYQYPHTIIFNFWTELGLLGLLSFLWLIVAIFSQAIKQLRVTRYALLVTPIAALVALLVHGLVDVPFFKNDLAILFWIIVALILISNPPLKIRGLRP